VRMQEQKWKWARVVVAGSAPCLDVPSVLSIPHDLLIAANGAAALLPTDILCTTSYLFRESCSPEELRTAESLAGLHFDIICLDGKSAPVDKAIRALVQLGITWERIDIIYDKDRSAVVAESCGKPLWVSTGVWAICLALVSRAASVRAVGISLGPGHVTGDTLPRQHVEADRECLQRLKERWTDKLILDQDLEAEL
jgi:hypothetical protein